MTTPRGALRPRAAVLPAVAVALVSGVLAVQVANGGGSFVPTPAADPCVQRTLRTVTTGIDGLGERLVLLGLDGAACRLGVTREALALQLATGGRPTEAQVRAVRAGLLEAVDRLKAGGMLPRASDLVDEAVDDSDLNRFVKIAIRALPDALINKALSTEDVVRRTIDNLDVRKVLTNIKNPDELTGQINSAVKSAVKAALIARLRDLL